MNLETIVKMSQSELKDAVCKHMVKQDYKGKMARGFVYFEGEVPVLLVAHLDTVHKNRVKHILYSKDGKLMSSPEGIGGDDRAGVFAILQIIKQHRCHVLFCEDEETGGRGAREFTRYDIRPEVNYLIELDRRGTNDAVFYDCANKAFTRFVCKFGFEKQYGSFSDISIIAPYLGIAAVNLSIGYFHEHSRHEYINLAKMQATIDRVCKMLAAPSKQFEYVRQAARRYRFEDYDDYSLYDYLERGEDMKAKKALMPLPKDAFLSVNGDLVSETDSFLLDEEGRVYDYLMEHAVAVQSEDTTAYSSAGMPIPFDRTTAIKVRVVPVQEAMELMQAG